jgi:hypothetical protein
LVGGPLQFAEGETGPTIDTGPISLGLTAADRELLDFLGRHPFLDPRQLAQVRRARLLGSGSRPDRLIAAGLVRQVAPDELNMPMGSGLLELTPEGLRMVAAQQGLGLGTAVRFNGLVGGGAERPWGPRGSLLRHLTHTRGVDALFIRLARQLIQRAEDGAGGDALVEWRSAAMCARGALRPDGYGIARHRGQLHGFFLEYDRGTMRAAGYLEKFAAYDDYLASGRFARDYVGFPSILMIAPNDAVEERIARAARAATVGRPSPLPLLLTTQWRIDDARNPNGLLGRIWRPPTADVGDRQAWPGPA